VNIDATSVVLDELVRGAQGGKEQDRELLLTRLRPMVCRWALIWTGSPDAAEDIAQSVLLRIDRSLSSLKPQGRTTTWAYQITRNVMIDLDRSRGREHELHDRVRMEEVAGAVVTTSGVASFEAVDLLKHLMQTLSAQQRAALDLVDLQGFSTQEAAEMLDIAPATVRVHLHRARQVLRARVEGETSIGGLHG